MEQWKRKFPVIVLYVFLGVVVSQPLGLQERPLGPGTMGWITSFDLYKSVVDSEPYNIKALVSFGGNTLLTKPNADDASKALE